METDTRVQEIECVPPSICFETNTIRRWGAKLVALFFILFAVAISGCLCLCCFAVGQFALPFIILVGATAVALLFFAVYYHRRILPGLRFCVIFHRDHLQVGRVFARQFFLYEEIDRIHASRDASLHVGCGKTTAAVVLTGQGMQDCITLLRQWCPNAYFVDEAGRGYLPVAPTCPERTLRGVEHHHARQAWVFVILALSSVITVLRLWVFGWNVLIFGLLAGLCVCMCLTFALRSWQLARFARRKWIEAPTSEALADNDGRFDASDNCSSHRDDAL